jgi:protein gp37
MGDETGIAWAGDAERKGATWSAWLGCTKLVEKRPGMPGSACDFCYAELNAEPKRRNDKGRDKPLWGKDGARHQCVTTWNDPITWNKKAKAAGRRLRVFVSSMGDIFEVHPTIDESWRQHAFSMAERCDWLDWLLLTKRPGNIARLVPPSWLQHWPQNVWLGTSVEHGGNLRRIDQLLSVPGGVPVRFLSCEPLLGPLDLKGYLGPDKVNWVQVGGESGSGYARPDTPLGKAKAKLTAAQERVDALKAEKPIQEKVLTTAKTEVKAARAEVKSLTPTPRRTEPEWIHSIRKQCRTARVAFFYKQPGDPTADRKDLRYVIDDDDPTSKREQWLLDGKAYWNWPATPLSPIQPKKRGRRKNVALGLSPALDDTARQARRRARKQDTPEKWLELIANRLDPLPQEDRKAAGQRLKQALETYFKNRDASGNVKAAKDGSTPEG